MKDRLASLLEGHKVSPRAAGGLSGLMGHIKCHPILHCAWEGQGEAVRCSGGQVWQWSSHPPNSPVTSLDRVPVPDGVSHGAMPLCSGSPSRGG